MRTKEDKEELEEPAEEKSRPAKKKRRRKRKVSLKTLIAAVVIVAVGMFAAGGGASLHYLTREMKNTETVTKSLGFADLGHLVTQSAYCKEVQVIEKARGTELFKIPFTESKVIFSYGFNIEAGYDFDQILPQVSEENKTVVIPMPEARIFTAELDTDSFEVLHDEESVFCRIDISDNNEALQEMRENAKQSALDGGLLLKARKNAEKLLTSFVDSFYGPGEYQVIFTESKYN